MRETAVLVAQRRRRADRARRAYWRRMEAVAAVLRPPVPIVWHATPATDFITSMTQAANEIFAKTKSGKSFMLLGPNAMAALKKNRNVWKQILEDPYDPYVHELKQPNCGLSCG